MKRTFYIIFCICDFYLHYGKWEEKGTIVSHPKGCGNFNFRSPKLLKDVLSLFLIQKSFMNDTFFFINLTRLAILIETWIICLELPHVTRKQTDLLLILKLLELVENLQQIFLGTMNMFKSFITQSCAVEKKLNSSVRIYIWHISFGVISFSSIIMSLEFEVKQKYNKINPF